MPSVSLSDINFGAILAILVTAAIILFIEEIRLFILKRRLDETLIGSEKRNIQLSYLTQIGNTLTSVLNKSKLLRIIVESLGELTKTEHASSLCALFLYDYNNNRYHYETGYDMDITMIEKEEFTLNDPPFTIFKKERTIQYYDEKAGIGQLLLKTNKLSYLATADHVIIIPLIVEGEIMGIGVCFLCKSSFGFLKGDQYLLQAVTSQISIALGSAVQSELAVLDRLTKIYNHAYFQNRLSQEIARADRYRYPVSLLMIDIDRFKTINDTCGHQEGDRILKNVAQLIKSNIRAVDLGARYGGEEFAVILPETNLTSSPERRPTEGVAKEALGGSLAKAEYLRKMVESHKFTTSDGKKLGVTISVGVSVKDYDKNPGLDKDSMIKKADRMLYRAKSEGRNRVCYEES